MMFLLDVVTKLNLSERPRACVRSFVYPSWLHQLREESLGAGKRWCREHS